MLEFRASTCFPPAIIGVFAVIACVDGALAVLAIWQLIRIHSRSSQHGWTRQKVFHLMIGLSNLGYVVYFILTVIATCKAWSCWSSSCGFVFMALPKILFLAAFLLLLSYWVDLCHQPNDEDDEGESNPHEALLEKTSKAASTESNSNQRCLPIPSFHVGSRQRIVIVVTVVVFVSMIAFAVLIWIGMGKNPIDSSTVARVYVDIFATGILLLGGALACYGLLIYLKMSKVRSERASSEMWKVTGLAVVSLVCFTASALVALLTDIPVLYRWHQEHISGLSTTLLLIVYYFIGIVLFWCPKARAVWELLYLDEFLPNQHESFLDWFSNAVESWSNEEIARLCIVCWVVWNARNQRLFEGKIQAAYEVAGYICRLLEEMMQQHTKLNRHHKQIVHWVPPSPRVIKINVDAGRLGGTGLAIGVICRSAAGHPLVGATMHFAEEWDVQVAEAKAVFFGIQLAYVHNFQQIVVESDCLRVVSALQSVRRGLIEFDLVIDDIIDYSTIFSSVVWSHVGRNGNKVAHELAHVTPWDVGCRFWEIDFPSSVLDAIICDLSFINTS